MGLLRARTKQLAGFADEGVPIILDENLARRGLAEALRKQGYNVRDVFEIFGKGGLLDEDILKVADVIGARVLTSDRGRQLSGGFMKRAIQVDQRATSEASLIRIRQNAIE